MRIRRGKRESEGRRGGRRSVPLRLWSALLCLALPGCEPSVANEADESPLAACGAPSGPPLALEQTLQGTLSDGCLLENTYLAVGHPLSLTNDVRVRFTLVGAGITPVLLITEPGGALVTGGSGLFGEPAEVEANLSAGSYVIWATTWAVAPPSSYSVSATEVDIVPGAASAPPPSPGVPSQPSRTDGTRRTEWPPRPSSPR